MSEDLMDMNKDGVVSPKEKADALASFDTNQDGVVSRAEVAASGLARSQAPGPNVALAAASNVPILGPLINNVIMGDLAESRSVYEAKMNNLYAALGLTDNDAVSVATGEPSGIPEKAPEAADPVTGSVDTDMIAAISAAMGTDQPPNPLLGFDEYWGTDAITEEKQLNGDTRYVIKVGDSTREVRYTKDNPLSAITSMTDEDLYNLRKNAYLGGYYGDTKPVFVGPANQDDLTLVTQLMTDANLSGLEWKDSLTSRAEIGAKYGEPLDAAAIAEETQQAKDYLQAFEYENGVPISKDFINRTQRKIAKGETTLKDVDGWLRKHTLSTAYPAFSDALKSGMNVRDVAAPYLSTMSNLLEISTDEIDLQDHTLRKAMQGQDGTAMPLWQFEENLKKDERWQYTDNAYAEIGQSMQSAMSMMGLSY